MPVICSTTSSRQHTLLPERLIVFGRMKVVDDRDKILEICTKLCLKFTDDKEYIEQEIKRSGSRVCCLALSVEHMTGKIVNES